MGAKRLTGGRNVLNWDKSSRRRGRNVLKMGAKRPGGETTMVQKFLEPFEKYLAPVSLAKIPAFFSRGVNPKWPPAPL